LIKEHQYEELEDEEEEENVDDIDELGKPSSTSVIILRLLQYCRREWIWHIRLAIKFPEFGKNNKRAYLLI
jgi:hypothetical protein